MIAVLFEVIPASGMCETYRLRRGGAERVGEARLRSVSLDHNVRSHGFADALSAKTRYSRTCLFVMS